MTATAARTHLDELARFVVASPSSFHAVDEAARLLTAAGFDPLVETDDWAPAAARNGLPGRHFVIRDGAIIAWITPPGASPTTPFRIVGAHTDSPGFKLKPKPTIGSHGWIQAGVEVYGGPLYNSWLDRELEFAGRLVFDDGTAALVRTGPFLRFPQLAVHLDRGVNSEGLKLDPQAHLNPVIGTGDPRNADLIDHLAQLAGRGGARVLGYDIVVADTAAPAVFGLDERLFASGRLDNLSSVHAGLTAMLRLAADTERGEGSASSSTRPADTERGEGSASSSTSPADTERGEGPASSSTCPADTERSDGDASTAEGARTADPATALGHIPVFAAFDHEEVGSETRSGASGPFLADTLVRIKSGATDAERARAAAASWCLSADAGHAVHPNYADRHDPVNRPIVNGGPLLKINANQRYATDATGAAEWARACAQAGVAYQEFVSSNAVPCGSTIGPLTATRLGIRTFDVGIALLSMHSARELCGVDDPASFAAAIAAFLAPA